MKIEPGMEFGPYRIVGPLGTGGMGEVFVAEDKRLARKVALKSLPPEMAADPERRMRFEREARAIAALNHPNIVTIHSVEEEQGTLFITMELVEGESLDERIPKDGMPLAKLFDTAIPIADALAAAHKQGITHRDLKPSNIMINKEGRVKVLDFGLAKLAGDATGGGSGAEGRTATVTQEGKVLGTVAYMSPEQAEGKPVDPRSDVFSLGILLYEMSSGRRPFDGDTPMSTITSIMRDQPISITELNATLPRHFGRIIRRCMYKDPERRYQSATGLRTELEELKSEVDSGELVLPGVAAGPVALPQRRVKKRWVAVAALAIAAVALVGLGYTMRGSRSEGSTTAVAPLTAKFTQLTSLPGVEALPSISPDGKSFVYTAGSEEDVEIFLQRVGGDRPVNLTEESPGPVGMPAFSPDGEQIAFASMGVEGGIFLMGSMGGSVRRLTEFGFNPAWSPDGRQIAFAEEPIYEPRNRNITSRLWVVDVETGETRKISDGDAVQPAWSPGGKRIAYWASRNENAQRDLLTTGVDGGEPVVLIDDRPLDWNPVWSPDGKHLYFSSDRGGVLNLWRLPVNETTGRATGEPVPITTPSRWVGGISVSGDGHRIVYAAREVRTRVEQAPFDPASRAVAGAPQKIYEGSRELRDIHPSPDGEWVAMVLTGIQEDICVVRRDGSGFRQLTDDPAKDRGVSWTTDGRIVFYSNRSGNYEAWTVRPDGSGLEPLTKNSKHAIWNPRVSPDGKRLAYNNAESAYLVDLQVESIQREPVEITPLDGEPGRFWHSYWSPDGKWLVGNDDQAGIVAYHVETGEYRRYTDSGEFAQGIPGTSLVLYHDNDQLWALDKSSGESQQVELGTLDVHFLRWVHFDPDTGMLIYLVWQEESDIWMAELE